MKNCFHAFAFKFNLYRYTAAAAQQRQHGSDGREPLVPPTLAEYNLRVKNAKRSLSTLKAVFATMLMQAGLAPFTTLFCSPNSYD